MSGKSQKTNYYHWGAGGEKNKKRWLAYITSESTNLYLSIHLKF